MSNFVEDHLLWEEPTPELGKSVRSPPEKKGTAGTSCDELTTAAIPHSSTALEGWR